ncbi:MAG: ROK family protein [Planctomycetales bacterium]|nr:ROK family protein [Planctomycetales bacterium]
MYLGIEIGGTKLQLAVSSGESSGIVELQRRDVDRSHGANGILQQISEVGSQLVAKHNVQAIGVGFGGPVLNNKVITSHHVSGWDGFDFTSWCQSEFGLPVTVDNDCNVAALAEATVGAGSGQKRVFYVTVGTGIGGGLVIDGKVYGNDRPGVAEIGHLRPGTECTDETQTVESISSGSGIENQYRLATHNETAPKSAKQIATLAAHGDATASGVMANATRTLGWAIAQTVTLTCPEIVVIGGGVSLIGEPFFAAVRSSFNQYAFRPLRDVTEIVPAQLGEDVVLHGAILLASSR